MRTIYQPGDKQYFERVVTSADTAAFESGEVHPVYATFAVARDAEWVCRLFVLDMKEADEEGIGTFVSVTHLSPALVGSTVAFEATVKSIEGNEIICTYKARVADRLIAEGEQGQRILKRERIDELFESVKD